MATAAIGTYAQVTGENWISSYPGLPSVADLIAYDKDVRSPDENKRENPLMTNFLQTVEDVMQKNSKVVGSTVSSELQQKAGAQVDDALRGTGLSAEQIAQMSEEQQQAVARQMIAGQLAGLGLSQGDLARMQNGQMSEADQTALASRMLQQRTGGVSIEDIQRMQSMTDEQRAAYMQQRGLAGKAPAQSKQGSSAIATQIMQAQTKLSEAATHYTNIIQLKETKAYGEALWRDKYATTYQQLHKEKGRLLSLSEDGADVSAEYEANERKIYETENSFYAEYIPRYHKDLSSVLSFIRNTYMTASRDLKNAMDQAYKQTGESRYKISEGEITIPARLYGEALLLIQDYQISLDIPEEEE